MGDKKQRKVKNYLLDRRFQLKYTGMVLLVTIAVASVLGYVAYDFSRGQTEAFTAQIAAQPDLRNDRRLPLPVDEPLALPQGGADDHEEPVIADQVEAAEVWANGCGANSRALKSYTPPLVPACAATPRPPQASVSRTIARFTTFLRSIAIRCRSCRR